LISLHGWGRCRKGREGVAGGVLRGKKEKERQGVREKERQEVW
jgi:hypothetical protein